MYNSKILIEMLSKKLKKNQQSMGQKRSLFLGQKILDKIEINNNRSRKQSAFVIKIEDYNGVNTIDNNFSTRNKKIKFFYNNIDFTDIKELITDKAKPIEKNIYNEKHYGKKYSKIFNIKTNENIFTKKLKPTPFENSRNKSNKFRNNVLLKQHLYSSNNLTNYVIKPFKTIKPLILDKISISHSRCDNSDSFRTLTTTRNNYSNISNSIIKNNENNNSIFKNTNKSFNKKKFNKNIYLLRPQCYFNLKNIIKIHNNIKTKKLIDI